MTEDTVPFVIVGAGKMGLAHGIAATSILNGKVVAVVSRREVSARNLAEKLGVACYTDNLATAIERSGAKAAIIAVSHDQTASILRQCLEIGLHSLVEKPVSLDPNTIRELDDIRSKRKVLVMVAMNRRFYPTVQATYLQSAWYGGILNIHINAPDHGFMYSLNSDGDLAVYKNWLYMNTIHIIDLLMLFGDNKLTYVASVIKKSGQNLDSFSVLAQIGSSGVPTTLAYSPSSGTMKNWSIVLHCKHCSIALSDSLEKMTITFPYAGTLPEGKTINAGKIKAGLAEQLQFFANSINANHKELPFPGCDLLNHANVIDFIYKST